MADNLPLALSTALVSVRPAVLVPVITAASLVPVMVTVMACVVPSAVATVMLSVTTCAPANESSAESVAYDQAPAVSIEK